MSKLVCNENKRVQLPLKLAYLVLKDIEYRLSDFAYNTTLNKLKHVKLNINRKDN